MDTKEERERWRLQGRCGDAAAGLLLKAFDGDAQKASEFFYENGPDDPGDLYDFYDSLQLILFQLAKNQEAKRTGVKPLEIKIVENL